MVGVLTYRRPECLERLLPVLVEQVAAMDGRVVVVDNDPDGGAEPEARRWAARGVTYVHEPEPGLAAARNRAFDEARDADVLVFIDDDEIPAAGWLCALVQGWQRWPCTAVAGPVRALFDGDVDPWIAGSGAFERRSLRTGTHVVGASTNNLLLDVGRVRRLGLAFDERFGRTGGEDTMFVHDLLRRGGTIRWCDEAEVHEPVRPERASRRWVLRRTFRAGTTWSRVALSLAGDGHHRRLERLELTVRALWRIGSGLSGLARGVLSRDVFRRARSVCATTSGAGMLAGAYGYRCYEYRR